TRCTRSSSGPKDRRVPRRRIDAIDSNAMTTDARHDENPGREGWNARFGAGDCVFGTEPNAFLAAQACRLRPGMSALCVADGEGRNSVWLARQGLLVPPFAFLTPRL